MVKRFETQLRLLKALIATPSYSGDEGRTADILVQWFGDEGIPIERWKNNLFAWHTPYRPEFPTFLLNSHHDTVRPNTAYSRDPFDPVVEGDRLYGLGSNDAGASLVALLGCFAELCERHASLPFNLLIAATAEEESAGPSSLAGLLPRLPVIDLALVGEPTLLQLAIAEKGLIVYDARIEGVASHAAHPNPHNPIYQAIGVLDWFRSFSLPKVSTTLGEVKLTVTQISAGSQHNVVPAHVDLVVDVRVNDCYTNAEVDQLLTAKAPCALKARSLRLGSSGIDLEHPLVQAGLKLGKSTYGSPTLSDQAALNCPSLKMGPGDSKRSHTADEYVLLSELRQGLEDYLSLMEGYIDSCRANQTNSPKN